MEAPSIISDDFWTDFIVAADLVYHRDTESQVYDVFEFIRIHLNGGKEWGEGLLRRVDAEIEFEERHGRSTACVESRGR